MSNILTEKHLTGNRCILRATAGPAQGRVLGTGDGGNFGPVQDVSANSQFGLQDVYELGNAERVEMVTGTVRHSVTVNNLWVDPKQTAYDPRDIILNDAISIEVIERASGQVIASYRECKFATRNVNFLRNALLTQSLQFEAISEERMKPERAA